MVFVSFDNTKRVKNFWRYVHCINVHNLILLSGGNCPEGLKQCIAECETEFEDEPDYEDRISGCLDFCEANCN